MKAGFLEAILIGLVAGYVVEALKKVRVSKYLRPIMPILLIPIISGRGRVDDQGTRHPHCTAHGPCQSCAEIHEYGKRCAT